MKLHFTKPDETTIERYVQQNTPLLAVAKGFLGVGIVSGELIRMAGMQDGIHRLDALYFLTYDHALYEYSDLSGLLEASFNADELTLSFNPLEIQRYEQPHDTSVYLDFDGIPVDD